jgi:hypothetical protein
MNEGDAAGILKENGRKVSYYPAANGKRKRKGMAIPSYGSSPGLIPPSLPFLHSTDRTYLWVETKSELRRTESEVAHLLLQVHNGETQSHPALIVCRGPPMWEEG